MQEVKSASSKDMSPCHLLLPYFVNHIKRYKGEWQWQA
jgi:hypothetical protein